LVGHTFVNITKIESNGTVVSITAGMYPTPMGSSVSGNPVLSPATIVDNTDHYYNVSYTMNGITATGANNALNALTRLSNGYYALTDVDVFPENNCSDCGIAVFNADVGSSFLPTNTTSFGDGALNLFFHVTPGSLGQYLRTINGVNTVPGTGPATTSCGGNTD